MSLNNNNNKKRTSDSEDSCVEIVRVLQPLNTSEAVTLLDSWNIEIPLDIGLLPCYLKLDPEEEIQEVRNSSRPKRIRPIEEVISAKWILESEKTCIPIPGRFVESMFACLRDYNIERALFLAMRKPGAIRIRLTRKPDQQSDSALFIARLEILLVDQSIFNSVMRQSDFELTLSQGDLHRLLFLVRQTPILEPPSNASEPALAEQIPGFQLQLWDWQKRNVMFLRRIEGDRSQQLLSITSDQLTKSAAIRVGQSDIWMDRKEGKLLIGEPFVRWIDPIQLECRGGIFCDPTSTGKSITVIASIWKQKLDNVRFNYYEMVMPKEEKAKFFKSKATLIVCPPRLVKQWEEYFKLCLGDRCVIVGNTYPQHPSPDKLLIKSLSTARDFSKLDLYSATQVLDVFLIPLSLLTSNAYLKRFDSPFDLEEKNKYQDELTRLNSLAKAGISRYEISRGIETLEKNRVYNSSWTNTSLLRVYNTVSNCRAALLREKDPVSASEIRGIPLEGIFWERKIIDEAHELVKGNVKRSLAVTALKANFSWLLTATPNFEVRANSEGSSSSSSSSSPQQIASLPALLNVNQISLKTDAPVNLTLTSDCWAMDAFLRTWCRKSGVIAKKPVTEHRVDVVLQPNELALYHSRQHYSISTLLQFCSYHGELQNVAEDQTTCSVSDTVAIMQTERKEKQLELESDLVNWDVTVERDWQELVAQIRISAQRFIPEIQKNETSRMHLVTLIQTEFALEKVSNLQSKHLDTLANKLQNSLQRQRSISNQLASVIRQQGYYDSIMQLLSNSNDVECAIHLGPIPMERTALLSCGHYFCEPCLNACWGSKTEVNCPACRHVIKKKRDLRIVDRRVAPQDETTDEQQQSSTPNNQEANIADRYGSKIRSLVELITNIRTDESQGKILVFAQWDHLLKQIGDALKILGISTAFPRGNIHQINAAFNQFYTDDNVRVLLLSTKNNLSGSHLVEANNLIFVHPFPDSPPESLREWEQAVSRMQRYGQERNLHVWYMITKNTIEPELYEMFERYKTSEANKLKNIQSSAATLGDDNNIEELE